MRIAMKHYIRSAALVLMAAMLSVNAFAAEKFTPSVEQKEAPAIVAPKTEHKVNGKPAVVVKDEKGEVVNAQAVDAIKVTPVSSFKDKDAAKPQTEEEKVVAESLDKTYTEIVEAKSLDVLAPELPDVLKELKVDTKVEDLVVQDLINVSVPKEMEDILLVEGNTIDLTFEMEVEEGKELIVMVQTADGEWVVISGDAIVIDDDGTVTISFPVVGNVAFIVA